MPGWLKLIGVLVFVAIMVTLHFIVSSGLRWAGEEFAWGFVVGALAMVGLFSIGLWIDRREKAD